MHEETAMPRLATTLALALVLPLAAACGGGTSPPPAGPVHLVTLLVSAPASPFPVGAEVELEVTLRNDGTIATLVTSEVQGALRIQAATRDGAALVLFTTNVDPEEDLGATLERGLASLAPGQAATFTLRSRSDASAAGQALSVLRPGPVVGEDVLGVALPGAYEVTLVYEYDGPVPAGATVFTATTAPAVAAFTVTP
jgi:hypothetical protein